MDEIIIGLSDYYNWLPIYCQYTVYEYERFLNLVANNRNITLLPPDIIEQCWQFHVLNMEHYYNYCQKRFNKILIYKPIEYPFDIRSKKINEAKQCYLQCYNQIKYKIIWIVNYTTNIRHDIQKYIIISINDKTFNYVPLLNESIVMLRETGSKKFNININRIKIYINEENSTFNLQQIYLLYGYKYESGYGTINNIPLPDKISLLDLYQYGYKKLRINVI
jgi:hypothetical protein